MNAGQKLIFIIVTLYYLFINFFYAFINFFNVRNKFNNYLHFTSFEKFRIRKSGLDVSNEVDLKNTDLFRTRGNPDLIYKKMNYLYPMDKDLHSTWPWLSDYLETYQFNTFDDTFLKKQKTRRWKNKIMDSREQWGLHIKWNFKDKDLKNPKALKWSPLKGARWSKPNHERFVYNYKWSNFKDIDYNEALFMQLESIDRNRRRLELLLDQDVEELEPFPLKDLVNPLVVECSLSEFPKTEMGIYVSPERMSADLASFYDPVEVWHFDGNSEKTVSDELINERIDRYNEYLFDRDKIIKKNEKINAQNNNLKLKKNRIFTPQEEVYQNIAYLQAKKRSEFFQKIFKHIIYCEPERQWPDYYYIGEATKPLEPEWVFDAPKAKARFQRKDNYFKYMHAYRSKKVFGKRRKWLFKKVKLYKQVFKSTSLRCGRPIGRYGARYTVRGRVVPIAKAKTRARKVFLHENIPANHNWRYIRFGDLSKNSRVAKKNTPDFEKNLKRIRKYSTFFDAVSLINFRKRFPVGWKFPRYKLKRRFRKKKGIRIPEQPERYKEPSVENFKNEIKKFNVLERLFLAVGTNRVDVQNDLKAIYIQYKKEHRKRYLKYVYGRIVNNWATLSKRRKGKRRRRKARKSIRQNVKFYRFYPRQLNQVKAERKWSFYNEFNLSNNWPHLVNTFDEDFYLYDDMEDIEDFYKDRNDLKEFFVDPKRRYFIDDWGPKRYIKVRRAYLNKILRNPKRIPNFEVDPRHYYKKFDTLYTDFDIDYIPNDSPVFVKNTKLNKLWKAFKINTKPFINENFIDLKLKNKNKKTYKMIDYYNKLLYAKYIRSKKYNKRTKNSMTYPYYVNIGQRSAFKHLRMLWDDVLHKDWDYFTNLTVNNINIPLIQYKWSQKIYRALEISFGFKPYSNILSYIYDSPIIITYFNWLIKIFLKVLNNRLVVWVWNSLIDLTDINYSKRYNKYLEKLAFNKTYTLDEKLKSFIFKFMVKSFIAIITFLTFLYNTIMCALQNFFLLNFSTIIDWLSYFN